MLYRIKAPYFVAGFLLTGNEVTKAAPIIKYMRDWTLPQVKAYCKKKGWQCDFIAGPG